MFDWLPATILGIAFFPFVLGFATFVVWWVFLTFEPVYVWGGGGYRYKTYRGGLFWGLIGCGLLVWLVNTMMGGISWDKFLDFYPTALNFLWKWCAVGVIWATARWVVEAYRGKKRWDRQGHYVANGKYKGDMSLLTDEEKYTLARLLPEAYFYRWSFFRWALLWPMSFLDTLFRDLVKLAWEWFYNLVSRGLDAIARKIYGHRFVARKSNDQMVGMDDD